MKKLVEIIKEIENKPIYNNATSQFSALIEELENERIKNLIIPKLEIIEKEIDSLFFSKIKKCDDLNEAKKYFDILQKIQEILAMLFYREEIDMSDKLQMFIRDYDRLDDSWLRNEILNKI